MFVNSFIFYYSIDQLDSWSTKSIELSIDDLRGRVKMKSVLLSDHKRLVGQNVHRFVVIDVHRVFVCVRWYRINNFNLFQYLSERRKSGRKLFREIFQFFN